MGTQPPPARKGYHSNPQRSSGNTLERRAHHGSISSQEAYRFSLCIAGCLLHHIYHSIFCANRSNSSAYGAALHLSGLATVTACLRTGPALVSAILQFPVAFHAFRFWTLHPLPKPLRLGHPQRWCAHLSGTV